VNANNRATEEKKLLLEYIISLLIAQNDIYWGFGVLMCIVIPLIWFIVWILVGIWVYRDAEARGMSGVLWLLIVILLGLLGIIIYLVVRKDKAPSQLPPPPS
jgi:Na+/H+-dicarboxylate symporter